MKRKCKIIGKHLLLAFLAFIWLIPIIWLFVTSLSGYKGINTMHFFPTKWTWDNYAQLFFRPDTVANFPAWFRVLSMIAIFFVMKLIGLTDSMLGLIIIYSAGSGLGYLICKGFFDTIPASLRESATLEGASQLCIFTRIVIPLSKPIIVYTVINSFLTPWMDFVMAKLMIRSKNPTDWTVAMGLFNLVQRTLVGDYFSVFCAGGIIVAIPISILFLLMQKFYIDGITGGAVKG